MKGCQARYTEPNMSLREEGQSNGDIFLHLYLSGHSNNCSAGAVSSSLSKPLGKAPKVLRGCDKRGGS